MGAVVSKPDMPGWVQASERDRSRRGATAGILGFLGVLTVIVVIVVAVSASGGSGSKNSTVGAGAGQTTSSTAEVHNWWVRGGEEHMTTVSRDAGGINDDNAAGDTVSQGQDCTSFQADIQAAQVYAPIPDETSQAHWASALELLAQSAADCADGVTNSDPALISKSVKELHSGVTELNFASSAVNALSGG